MWAERIFNIISAHTNLQGAKLYGEWKDYGRPGKGGKDFTQIDPTLYTLTRNN
jgi:hypothetical protein